MFKNKLNLFSLILIFCLFVLNSAISASKNDNKKKLDKSEIKTEHLVSAKILYDEIYDINISEGHYRASVELLLIWEDPKTQEFLNKFGDEIIHGKKLDDYLETIWYPEFFVSNAENPRTLHYKTLDVYKGKFELFERFDVDLSIDAEMPRYPFGDLDLFLDIASFSGNKDKMVFYPETIEIGHHDAHHKIVKGNWKVTKTYLEEQGRTSLNHGGKEKFSYLISHVNVEHGFIDSLQKIIFPLLAIVILSLLINHFYIAGNYDRWSWRVGGQLTLFLTIPALKFALSGELPSTHYLNLTDSLFIWATIVVTYNMTLGILSHYKSIEEGSTEIQTIDKFARISSPLVAIGVIATFSFTII